MLVMAGHSGEHGGRWWSLRQAVVLAAVWGGRRKNMMSLGLGLKLDEDYIGD